MDARDAPEVTRKTAPAGLPARIPFVLVVAAALLMVVFVAQPPAWAKRLSGGHTAASQPSSMASREATAVPHAAPAALPAVLPSAHAAPAAGLGAAASAASGSRWLAPVAGLAAGLGIASVAGSVGIDEDLMTGALVAMLAAVVLVPFVLWLSARRSSGRRQVLQPSVAYAGLGQEAMVPQQFFLPEATQGARPIVQVIRPRAGGVQPTAHDGLRVPADFDAGSFIEEAKAHYLRLQAAHDAGDLDRLREFTTAELFVRIQAELAANGASGTTEFPALDVQLLSLDSNGFEQTASVRFRGSSRSIRGGEAESFDEVWSLRRPLDARHGWVLAGIQPLR